MKKHFLLVAGLLFVMLTDALAQEQKEVIRKGNKEIIITKDGNKETMVTVEVDDNQPKNNRSETREIIIRKDGENETKMMVEINGDEVKINGKPMNDFNQDGVKMRKKKMIIVNGETLQEDILGEEMPGNLSIQGWGNMDGKEFSINGDMKDFTEEKTDTVAFLGVTTEPDEKGTRIAEIVAGSAAEKSGLLKDDVIIEIDGEKVTDPQGLTALIRKHRPNDIIKINYWRNGKTKSSKVTLQEKIIKNNIQKKVIIRSDKNGNAPEVFGFQIPEMGDLSQAFPFPRKQKLGIKIQDTEDGVGVKVLGVESGSAAEKAGLQKDDVVIEIADAKVNNTDEAREQLQENAEKNQYTIKANRNGKTISFEVTIPKKLKTIDL